MNVNGEKLRQAKSFDELKAGMITVIRGCDVCGRSWCRGILVELIGDPARDNYGWLTLPVCDGGRDSIGIGPQATEDGDVFIVDDGLGKETEKQKETHGLRR